MELCSLFLTVLPSLSCLDAKLDDYMYFNISVKYIFENCCCCCCCCCGGSSSGSTWYCYRCVCWLLVNSNTKIAGFLKLHWSKISFIKFKVSVCGKWRGGDRWSNNCECWKSVSFVKYWIVLSDYAIQPKIGNALNDSDWPWAANWQY